MHANTIDPLSSTLQRGSTLICFRAGHHLDIQPLIRQPKSEIRKHLTSSGVIWIKEAIHKYYFSDQSNPILEF